MDSESRLKELLQDLEATPREMAVYREKLSHNLMQKTTGRSTRILWPVVAIAAVLLVGFLLFPRSKMPFDELSLESVQLLVETSEMRELSERARAQVRSENGWSKLNAYTILCMTLPAQEAIPFAGQALEEDPRPEFRAFYLEFLLDTADENLINSERVEALMDDEENELCLRLLHDLLNVS